MSPPIVRPVITSVWQQQSSSFSAPIATVDPPIRSLPVLSHQIGIEDLDLLELCPILVDELRVSWALEVLCLGFLAGEDHVQRDVEVLHVHRLCNILARVPTEKYSAPSWPLRCISHEAVELVALTLSNGP